MKHFPPRGVKVKRGRGSIPVIVLVISIEANRMAATFCLESLPMTAEFSANEKKRLAPFFTNDERPVFGLKLPQEVVHTVAWEPDALTLKGVH